MSVAKVLYTAHTTTTGGREGSARSSDGALDLRLTTPKELGGSGTGGVNPEQLFGAGYSACFIGAMKHIAMTQKIALPADLSIATEVGIGPSTTGPGFAIQVAMNISLPGMAREAAEQLIASAHQVCPYSNATRGNIDVTLTLV